jgi:hypothetical protein
LQAGFAAQSIIVADGRAEPVRGGLATATPERMVAGKRMMEVGCCPEGQERVAEPLRDETLPTAEFLVSALILLRLLGLAAGRPAGGTRHIPSCGDGIRTTCTIRDRKAHAASMNSSRAPARPARMPTSESWRPTPSSENQRLGDLRRVRPGSTPCQSPRPHQHRRVKVRSR